MELLDEPGLEENGITDGEGGPDIYIKMCDKVGGVI